MKVVVPLLALLSPLITSLPSLTQAEEMEQMLVTAHGPDHMHNYHQLQIPQNIRPEHELPSQNPAELVLNSPDAALNGQAGMLQMYSIRGLSRWRVQTLIEDVPINTDRRAGSAASFVPPAFIEQLQLIPGAASSAFGSGALGGAVNLNLLNHKGTHGVLASDTNQNSANLSMTSSNGSRSLGISYRQADMGSDAEGNPLNDGYEHLAGMMRKSNATGLVRDTWALISEGNNWGKSSSRFPDNRRTVYPENDHIALKTQLQINNIQIEPFVHHANLHTTIERSDSLTFSENNALNYGVSAHRLAEFSTWQYSWRVGIRERSDVNGTEEIFDKQHQLLQSQTTLSGKASHLFGHGDFFKQWGRLVWAGGLHISHASLENDQQPEAISDQNWSGYSGINWQASSRWTSGFYASTAYRTPALTELFFRGETPRGQVLGNSALLSENAVNMEYDLRYTSPQLDFALSTFYQRIDNYIERISIGEDSLQYQNVANAKIQGISYQVNYTTPQDNFHIKMAGQWLSGKNNDNMPLVDISPHHHSVSFRHELYAIYWQIQMRHRMKKHQIADGEQTLPQLTTLALSLGGQLSKQWRYRLIVNNVTNELAHTSADEDAPFIRGRHGAIELRFTH